MAEQVEAGAAVHLAHDPFGFGVDAFGSAVVVRQGQAGVDGVAVLVEAAGEGVQVRQVGRAGGGDPAVEEAVVAGAGSSRPAKAPTRPVRSIISGQAAVRSSRRSDLLVGEAGPGG